MQFCDGLLSDEVEFYCPGDTEQVAFAGLWIGTSGMQDFFDRFFSLFSCTAGTLQPTYLEAILVANWASGPAAIPKDKRRRGNRAALQARLWAMLFPNMRAHTYRVSGRAAAANGKIAKAIRFFDAALEAATKFGNRAEYARALIDKSMLIKGEQKHRRRDEGLHRLQQLHTVLPEAESRILQADSSSKPSA